MKIELNNVSKKYGVFEALAIDHLFFESGQAYGIIGPNGSGKTTLFKCITNIITDYSGDILIDDQLVREENHILANVGIVLDDMSLYKKQSGWFNIQYFSKLRGYEKEELALELAKELEIAEVLDEPVRTYSYGMTKKLILLIALLNQPKILILDEPFRGLDGETVTWFKSYLKKLNETGLTLLISSHVRTDIVSLCQKVMVLRKGKFEKEIDLNEFNEKMIRDCLTTNQDCLITILDDLNYYYQVRDHVIRLNINDERWAEVKRRLDQEDVEITSLSIVNFLENQLN
ncbi:ATP-binding cassette domain-containing protein [Vagococcus sp.]|uniref:ATP-binding cassette domain-containing protein n=1 Tax=Vagococcus sp. TaxID=1933889 RepID=UPI003F9E8199